jgi:ParB-like nuclease domain
MAQAKQGTSPLNLDQFFRPSDQTADLDFLLGAAPEATAQRALDRDLPLLHLPISAIAPDAQQIRRLPHPNNLVQMATAGDRAAVTILAGLRELGQSMVEHGQVQPAIVYPDTDLQDLAITHRLLHGQRRWSAALLAGLPTLWVVEVPKPSNVIRLLRQFAENERRTGLSDMERAWALVALKDALQTEAGSEVPWSVVEEQLQISDARRHDLLRLLRFSSDGQAIILRYGWSEWTLRPLHMAIQAGSIDQDAANGILRELADAAEVSAALVTAAVEAYRRQRASAEGQPVEEVRVGKGVELPAGAQQTDVLRRLLRAHRGVEQVQRQAPLITDLAARAALLDEAQRLMARLQSLVIELSATRPA